MATFKKITEKQFPHLSVTDIEYLQYRHLYIPNLEELHDKEKNKNKKYELFCRLDLTEREWKHLCKSIPVERQLELDEMSIEVIGFYNLVFAQ